MNGLSLDQLLRSPATRKLVEDEEKRQAERRAAEIKKLQDRIAEAEDEHRKAITTLNARLDVVAEDARVARAAWAAKDNELRDPVSAPERVVLLRRSRWGVSAADQNLAGGTLMGQRRYYSWNPPERCGSHLVFRDRPRDANDVAYIYRDGRFVLAPAGDQEIAELLRQGDQKAKRAWR